MQVTVVTEEQVHLHGLTVYDFHPERRLTAQLPSNYQAAMAPLRRTERVRTWQKNKHTSTHLHPPR